MTLRPRILENRAAFLKRRSFVRIEPGTPLSSQILGVDPIPAVPLGGVEKGVSGTKTVQGPNPYGALSQRWRDSGISPVTRGAGWLSEATAHVRRHYPGDGLTESVLYALHRVGFDLPPPAEPEVVVQSDEDVFEPWRQVVSG